MWIDAGLERMESAQLALDSVHDDLLHHGELIGIEVKIIDFTITNIDGTSMSVTGELGVSDSSTTLQTNISFIISV
jgi:hypothetical protein